MSASRVTCNVTCLLQLGAVPEKTVLGVPLYGRAFTLVDAAVNDIGAPTKDTAFEGPFTRENGFLGYNEICVKQIQDSGAGPGWRVQWEESYR